MSTCTRMADRLAPGHVVGAGQYVSAGVMALWNAGCVSPHVMFKFHSAYYVATGELAPSGNIQMTRHLSQWPRLLEYLTNVGAFNRKEFTTLYSWDLQALGVPICGRDR